MMKRGHFKVRKCIRSIKKVLFWLISTLIQRLWKELTWPKTGHGNFGSVNGNKAPANLVGCAHHQLPLAEGKVILEHGAPVLVLNWTRIDHG